MELAGTEKQLDYCCWSWGDPKYGTLVTQVFEDGRVQQIRQHPADGGASVNDWGRVTPSLAREIIEQAREIFQHAEATERPAFPPTCEYVEVRVPAEDGERGLMVPVAELTLQPKVAELRGTVVRLRKQIAGGFFSWRSIGGRLTILLTLVVGALTWWIIRDWRETSAMAKSAERLDARVLSRVGTSGYDSSKAITVQFTPRSGVPIEQKIDQYVSAENWDRASPGTSVRVWHDPASGHTYLQDDIERWNRDKHWIPLLPIGISVPIIVIAVCLSSYRVGVHDDGREYLVVEDYVAGDDRNALVDRTNYNAGRLLWWLAKKT